jgi:hypothetical protein
MAFSVAVQKPGDLILTDTQGSHHGYNAGNNLAIAANWATMDWITHNLAQHLNPHTHDIVHGCQCFSTLVGIPFNVWTSKLAVSQRFKHLHTLGNTAAKMSSNEGNSAATVWCFYIFLGVEYLHHNHSQIPWLEGGK